MTFASFLALLPAILGFAGVQSASVRTMTIEEHVVMRIPVRPWTPPHRIEWIEHKGPKCIPADAIRGAALSGSDHVDFVLAGRERIRFLPQARRRPDLREAGFDQLADWRGVRNPQIPPAGSAR